MCVCVCVRVCVMNVETSLSRAQGLSCNQMVPQASEAGGKQGLTRDFFFPPFLLGEVTLKKDGKSNWSCLTKRQSPGEGWRGLAWAEWVRR